MRPHNLPWKVYGLIDPRDGRVFYVGVSYIVQSRVVSHNSDPASSAWHTCREIVESGTKPDYCIFGSFALKRSALFLEASLITAIPKLTNRTHRDERKKLWDGVSMDQYLN